MRISKDLWVLGESSSPSGRAKEELSLGEAYFWSPYFHVENHVENRDRAFYPVKNLETLSTSQFKGRLKTLFPKASGEKPLLDLEWELAKKEDFFDQIHQLKFLFQTGILKKAVPFAVDRAQSRSASGVGGHIKAHLLYFLEKLADLPDSLFPYGLLGPEILLGATPEILISKKGDHASTHALAGTATDSSVDLLKDPKERLEHQMVVDEITSILKSFGEFIGEVRVGETREKVLPRLKHLLTPIEILNFTAPLVQVAERLHPTPALGGLPQKAALEWLRRQPNCEIRHRFGAPFGYVDPAGDGTILVAIRNIQVVDEELRLAAGCGIVPQSDAEKEWTEVSGKKDSIKAIWNCL